MFLLGVSGYIVDPRSNTMRVFDTVDEAKDYADGGYSSHECSRKSCCKIWQVRSDSAPILVTQQRLENPKARKPRKVWHDQ